MADLGVTLPLHFYSESIQNTTGGMFVGREGQAGSLLERTRRFDDDSSQRPLDFENLDGWCSGGCRQKAREDIRSLIKDEDLGIPHDRTNHTSLRGTLRVADKRTVRLRVTP